MLFMNIINTCAAYIYANLNLWTLLTILIVVSCWRLKKPHSHYPPGPIGYPLLGVLPQMLYNSEKYFSKWIEKYGPILSIPLPRGHVVYLNTFESVNEAFLKQGSKFSGRPFLFTFHQLTHNDGLVFKNYGEDYKAQRKFGNKVLRSFGIGEKRIQEAISKEAAFLVKHLKSHTGNPYDMKSDLYNITANIISAIVLGQRFEYGDPKFRKILWSAERTFGEPGDSLRMNMMTLFPGLRYLPYFSDANKRLINNQIQLLDLAKQMVEEHKESFDPNNLKDFIDYYLYEQMHGIGKNDEKFNSRQLEVYVRDLFFAGTDTSSNTISWAILTLLHYPRYMKILEDEIEQVVGLNATPAISDRSKMPFTCAFIQELMRFKTLVPGGIPHRTTADAELLGYHIPRGTLVVSNLQAVNHDSRIWTNPEEFNPYRHINKDGAFMFSSKIIPFSVGPRICLGEQLARIEIFLIIVTLLQKFKIHKDPKVKLPSLEQKTNSLVVAPLRYNVVLEERVC